MSVVIERERPLPLNLCPAYGVTLRPLSARRFAFWGNVAGDLDGAYVWQTRVPVGVDGVINVIGGLVMPKNISYSLRINDSEDAVVWRIGEYSASNVPSRKSVMWPRANYGGGYGFVTGTFRIDPIRVTAGQVFGLWAIHTMGTAFFGMGGGVFGYWYSNLKPCQGVRHGVKGRR